MNPFLYQNKKMRVTDDSDHILALCGDECGLHAGTVDRRPQGSMAVQGTDRSGRNVASRMNSTHSATLPPALASASGSVPLGRSPQMTRPTCTPGSETTGMLIPSPLWNFHGKVSCMHILLCLLSFFCVRFCNPSGC